MRNLIGFDYSSRSSGCRHQGTHLTDLGTTRFLCERCHIVFTHTPSPPRDAPSGEESQRER
jgi:hypothetical protein